MSQKMTNEESQGFTPEQLKDIFIKLEMSRMLMKMSLDMTKQIEEDIKFYKTIGNIEEKDNE
jgi:hypothetical protein